MSEKALASAVLHLAADDYRSPEPAKKESREWRDWNEARLFCTQAEGPWARSREAWCALAGIDPDVFREMCIASQVAA